MKLKVQERNSYFIDCLFEYEFEYESEIPNTGDILEYQNSLFKVLYIKHIIDYKENSICEYKLLERVLIVEKVS